MLVTLLYILCSNDGLMIRVLLREQGSTRYKFLVEAFVQQRGVATLRFKLLESSTFLVLVSSKWPINT